MSEIAQNDPEPVDELRESPDSPDEQRERTWLLEHVAGDRGAFARLVEAYRAPVYSYLVRSGIPEADRDDLFQELFIRVHRAAASYNPERAVAPWLFTIVANAVRNHLRTRRVRELIFRDREKSDPADPAELADERIEAEQNRAWLEDEIRRLPRTQREALLLTYVKPMPRSQIAAALGIPINTLKTNLRRARLELVRRLGLRDRRPTAKVKR